MNAGEEFYRLLFKGELDKAVGFLKESLGDYGELFYWYYSTSADLQKSMNPYGYPDKMGLIKSSLLVVMKKAYRNRDMKQVILIKELLETVKAFEVDDDIP
ncbi:hypothetical protein [Persephonella sp.]